MSSNCDWVDCNNVARPHKSSVRAIAQGVLEAAYLGPIGDILIS